MKTVYKYEIANPSQQLSLPKGYEILCAKCQSDRWGEESLFLWALVDPDEVEREAVTIRVFGTGTDIDDDIKLSYIDTVMMNGGKYVFHVFKQEEK